MPIFCDKLAPSWRFRVRCRRRQRPPVPSLLALLLGAAVAHAEPQRVEVAVPDPTARLDTEATSATSQGLAQAPATELEPITVRGKADPVAAREQGFRGKRQSAAGFGEQSVLDTPFSVTVMPAELLRDQQARSLADLVRNVAGAAVAESSLGFYDRVQLRGFYIGEQYRDGLRINDQAQVPLENRAAVEVVTGLSALFHGLSAPGGVVNHVIKRPTDETLTQGLLYGNGFGGVGASVDLSRRLGSEREFGVRVNLAAEEERTYIDEIRGPRRFASVAADWRLSPALLLEAELEHQTRELPSPYGLYNGIFAPGVDERAVIERFDRETFLGQAWESYPTRNNLGSVRLRYAINDAWTLTAAAGWQRLWRDQNSTGPEFGAVQANGDADISLYYAPNQRRNTEAQQVRLNGRFVTGAWRHDLTLGAERNDASATAPNGFYEVIGQSNILSPVVLPDPSPTIAQTGESYRYARTQDTSIFIADNIELSPAWRVTGGLRYIRPDLQGFDSTGQPDGEAYRESAWTGSLGVIWRPAPALSVYASYIEGLEGGGTAPNDPTIVNAGDVLPPLRSEQIEVGLKYELGRDALLTVAVFEIDKGLELLQLDGAAGFRYTQDGRQVHRGVEVGLSGSVLPGLRLTSGMAWLDATVKDAEDPTLQGKRPQGVAEWQANLFADWRMPVDREWFVNGGVVHTGNRAMSLDNAITAPSYTRLDLGLRHATRIGTAATTFRLSLQNVTDRNYIEGAAFGNYGFGAPRTVLFSAEATI